ncbi:MAG: C4-dicarboxylate ABC transporter, partial [Pseudomonadota bacterium]
MFELLVNKDVWEDLDEKSQRQIEVACMANITDNYAEGEATNYAAMVENTDKHGVTIKQWPQEMLDTFESTWTEVAQELAAEDEMFKKVWDDLQEFRAGYKVWSDN